MPHPQQIYDDVEPERWRIFGQQERGGMQEIVYELPWGRHAIQINAAVYTEDLVREIGVALWKGADPAGLLKPRLALPPGPPQGFAADADPPWGDDSGSNG